MRASEWLPLHGQVLWLTKEQGGRDSGPPLAPADQDFAATGLVPPATPATELASVVLRVEDRTAWRSKTDAGWLVIDNQPPHQVGPDAVIVVPEGRPTCAYLHVGTSSPTFLGRSPWTAGAQTRRRPADAPLSPMATHLAAELTLGLSSRPAASLAFAAPAPNRLDGNAVAGCVLGVRQSAVRCAQRAVDDALGPDVGHDSSLVPPADNECRVWDSNPQVLADNGF
jgi:hypothetical protein